MQSTTVRYRVYSELLQRRPHRDQQLENDGRRYIRHDPQAEDRALFQVTTRKQLEVVHQIPKGTASTSRGTGTHPRLIDTRNRNVKPDPIDRKHPQRKQNLVTQLRDLEHVNEGADHSFSSTHGVVRPIRACLLRRLGLSAGSLNLLECRLAVLCHVHRQLLCQCAVPEYLHRIP